MKELFSSFNDWLIILAGRIGLPRLAEPVLEGASAGAPALLPAYRLEGALAQLERFFAAPGPVGVVGLGKGPEGQPGHPFRAAGGDPEELAVGQVLGSRLSTIPEQSLLPGLLTAVVSCATVPVSSPNGSSSAPTKEVAHQDALEESGLELCYPWPAFG